MTSSRFAHCLCLCLALSAGCTSDPAEEDLLGETTQDLYVKSSTQPWPLYSNIPLCFTYSSGDTTIPVNQRAAVTAFVKERIRLTWAAVLPFQFSFRDCPTSGPNQEFMVDLSWHDNGGVCTMGMAGLTTAAERNADPEHVRGCRIGIPPDWNFSQTRLRQTQTVVIHEIGHLLGFAHEFNRPDAGDHACDVADAPGGLVLGDYDESSIMLARYCGSHQSWLSPDDVTNARGFYGVRTPPQSTKDIVWQSTSGSASIFRMSGTLMASEYFIPDTFGTTYRIIGGGDFDGDGIGDLLWRGPDGAVVIWLLNADGMLLELALPWL